MLTEASRYHQAFIDMTQNKGRFSPQEAAVLVEKSESLYAELLNTDPEDAIVRYQWATLLMQTGRNGPAIVVLKPLAKQDPKLEYLNNLGAAYRNEHMNEEAKAAFERALEIERHPDVLANLCAQWVNEGYPEKGIPYGEECLRKIPNHPQAMWNLGLLYLENRNYEEGFALYAKGFETGERIKRYYKDSKGQEAKFWKGEPLAGKSIVLHGEQGIGDELLFLQFAKEFIRQYPETKVVLDVHPRLEKAVKRSFPEVPLIFGTRKTRETPEWNKEIPVDYKDGVGSLPKYYHKVRRKHCPWLIPDEALVEKYSSIIQEFKESTGLIGKPTIGIAWTGGRKKTRKDLRSIPLEQWVPILEQDALFVSLEYWDTAAAHTSAILRKENLYVHHWPDVVQNFDYDHTIALVQACDLVISVNTSVVHVAGSLQKPCWTLVPHGHAWRYGKKDEINPFYNSVSQYHQRDEEDWTRVIHKVQEDLATYIRRKKP